MVAVECAIQCHWLQGEKTEGSHHLMEGKGGGG
jgi:hypothetical protein